MNELIINIGAAFAGSFRTVLGGVQGELRTLGSSLQNLRAQAQAQAMGRLQTGRDRLGQNRRAYQALEQQLAQLNRTTQAARPLTRSQTSQQAALRRQIEQAAEALAQETQALNDQDTALQNAGVETHNLAS